MRSKENKEKKKNIFIYFICMCILFFIINMFAVNLPIILGESVFYEKYGIEFIVEMFFALVVLVIMLMSKNHYVFTEKRQKFFKSILLGLPVLIIAVISAVDNILGISDFNFYHLINILLYSFSVGIAEEFLCRGWLQNEFIERFGKNKKQVILSIFLSSLIFGAMHFSNVLGQTLFETILQVIQATASGFLLGSIYYRTKNIWAVIFIHGFYDFCLMLGEIGVLKDCVMNPNPSTSMVIFGFALSIILIIIYTFNSLLIMQNSKIKDNYEVSEPLTEVEIKKEKKYSKIYIVIISILLLLVLIPVDIPGNDDYMTCYEFEKLEVSYEEWLNSESHLPKYEDYSILHTRQTISYSMIEEINTELVNNEEFEFRFYLDENNDYLLTIENVKTGKKVSLDYEWVQQFEVIENGNNYIIIIHDYDMNSIIYYSDFMTKDNLSNSDDYLNKVKESFVEVDVPNLMQIGYMTSRDSDYKYPYLITEYDEKMIIDENKDLYLMELVFSEEITE